jgi:hypothetical protein
VFQIVNQTEFDAGLEGWLASCALLADDAFRGLTWAAFDFIAKGTPQWSGNLAGSWTLSVGAPSTEVRLKPDLGKAHWEMDSPFHKGHPLAVDFAELSARPVLAQVHLGVDAYITNPSPYATPVQENVHEDTGKAFLREVNLPVEMVEQAKNGIPGYGPELSEAVIVRYAKGTL